MAVLSRKKTDVSIVEAEHIITSCRLDEAHSSYSFVCELGLPREYLNFEGTLESLKRRIEADAQIARSRTAQYETALERLKTL